MQNDSRFLLVQVQQGPASLPCSLESSACFSGLCILDFSILNFFLMSDLWGIKWRFKETTESLWYKIDLTVLLKILSDRLTLECVRPLVHSPSLKKKLPSYTAVQHTVISWWSDKPSPSSRLTMTYHAVMLLQNTKCPGFSVDVYPMPPLNATKIMAVLN